MQRSYAPPTGTANTAGGVGRTSSNPQVGAQGGYVPNAYPQSNTNVPPQQQQPQQQQRMQSSVPMSGYAQTGTSSYPSNTGYTQPGSSAPYYSTQGTSGSYNTNASPPAPVSSMHVPAKSPSGSVAPQANTGYSTGQYAAPPPNNAPQGAVQGQNSAYGYANTAPQNYNYAQSNTTTTGASGYGTNRSTVPSTTAPTYSQQAPQSGYGTYGSTGSVSSVAPPVDDSDQQLKALLNYVSASMPALSKTVYDVYNKTHISSQQKVAEISAILKQK
jgi:hypothetical protein